MQTIVCMRWGDRFPVDYVNRLYRGVMRNVTRPTRFIVFTDDRAGLDSGVEPREIPPIRLPATGLGGSPWRKLALWSRDIGLEGDFLFLDLDVVAVGGLDVFFDHEPGKLAILRDWSARGSGNSSVMRVPAGAAPHLVDRFEADPLGKRRRYSNEQAYLCAESGLPLAFWPSEWAPGFKAMMLPRFPRNLYRTARSPTARGWWCSPAIRDRTRRARANGRRAAGNGSTNACGRSNGWTPIGDEAILRCVRVCA